MRRGNDRRVLRGLAAGVLAAGLGLAGLVAGGSAASAHDFLVSTTPAADTTVSEALTSVSLTFNEPPLTELGAGIAIQVNDPAGATVSSGEVSIVDSTLGIAVAPTTVGAYTVIWQTVSSDGHPVSGEYTFDYQGPVAAAPTENPATPAAPAVTPGDAATATAEPDTATSTATEPATPAADGSSAVPLVLVGVGAAVVLLIAVVVVLAVVLRRRPRA